MEPTPEQRRLAQRLRSLREDRWPALGLTQPRLGSILGGISPASISSWESDTNPKVPPTSRLVAYARFFSTDRSVTGKDARMLDDVELTDDESRDLKELQDELLAMRAAALRSTRPALRAVPSPSERRGTTWEFLDGRAVTIICGELPERYRAGIPGADPGSPDYTELYACADLDSLLELHGHIRAMNPKTQVNVRLTGTLTEDDYTTHLVVVGGVDWNDVTRDLLTRIQLPAKQVSADDRREAYFEVSDNPNPIRAEFAEDGSLLADVAHFYRGPSPYNLQCTVTMCNGIYARGTLGVVRALTDARFRDRNEVYLADTFGNASEFSILTRVTVAAGITVTPDWTQDCLHAWSGPSNDTK